MTAERMRKDDLGILLWLTDALKVRVPACGLNFPPVPKEGVP